MCTVAIEYNLFVFACACSCWDIWVYAYQREICVTEDETEKPVTTFGTYVLVLRNTVLGSNPERTCKLALAQLLCGYMATITLGEINTMEALGRHRKTLYNCRGLWRSKILLYLQANRLACRGFKDASRVETEPEAKDSYVTHSSSRCQRMSIFAPVPKPKFSWDVLKRANNTCEFSGFVTEEQGLLGNLNLV